MALLWGKRYSEKKLIDLGMLSSDLLFSYFASSNNRESLAEQFDHWNTSTTVRDGIVIGGEIFSR